MCGSTPGSTHWILGVHPPLLPSGDNQKGHQALLMLQNQTTKHSDLRRSGARRSPHRWRLEANQPGLWNFQRVLHTLAATQEVPRRTPLHSRGSTRVLPKSREAPFPPDRSRGGILSLRCRERIPGVPVASQEEPVSTGNTRGSPGS